MMQWRALLAGAIVFCAAGRALAREAPSSEASDEKVQIGLRLGYALPSGTLLKSGNVAAFEVLDSKLSDSTSGQIPIWLDLGYRVTPELMLGAYAQYGFLSVKGCPQGYSCSAHDLRVGLQGQYHFQPGGTDPWLGLGVGYEAIGASGSRDGADIGLDFSGWELVNLQAGLDFRAARALSVGPFVSFSVDEFTTLSLGSTNGNIDEKALHEWILFGVKGAVGL